MRPRTPANRMMGASARRYTAERSINVRMVCRFSSAQFDSIIILCKAKLVAASENKPAEEPSRREMKSFVCFKALRLFYSGFEIVAETFSTARVREKFIPGA